MESAILDYAVQLGPAGAVLIIAMAGLTYLKTKGKSDREERTEARKEQKEERKEARESQENVLGHIVDSNEKNTAEITQVLRSLTQEFQQHDTRSQTNSEQCSEFRKKMEAKT